MPTITGELIKDIFDLADVSDLFHLEQPRVACNLPLSEVKEPAIVIVAYGQNRPEGDNGLAHMFHAGQSRPYVGEPTLQCLVYAGNALKDLTSCFVDAPAGVDDPRLIRGWRLERVELACGQLRAGEVSESMLKSCDCGALVDI